MLLEVVFWCKKFWGMFFLLDVVKLENMLFEILFFMQYNIFIVCNSFPETKSWAKMSDALAQTLKKTKQACIHQRKIMLLYYTCFLCTRLFTLFWRILLRPVFVNNFLLMVRIFIIFSEGPLAPGKLFVKY